MTDTATTIHTLKESIRKFNEERNWAQYNTPKNLSMALSVESAELMEHFTWLTQQESLDAVGEEEKRVSIIHEVADIAILLMGLCNAMDLDLSGAVREKLLINAKKYPLEGD